MVYISNYLPGFVQQVYFVKFFSNRWNPSLIFKPLHSLFLILYRLCSTLKFSLILSLQPLQVLTQALWIQPWVTGRLQQSGGQTIDCPLFDRVWITVMLGLWTTQWRHGVNNLVGCLYLIFLLYLYNILFMSHKQEETYPQLLADFSCDGFGFLNNFWREIGHLCCSYT